MLRERIIEPIQETDSLSLGENIFREPGKQFQKMLNNLHNCDILCLESKLLMLESIRQDNLVVI